jgi:hypothetical protein
VLLIFFFITGFDRNSTFDAVQVVPLLVENGVSGRLAPKTEQEISKEQC